MLFFHLPRFSQGRARPLGPGPGGLRHPRHRRQGGVPQPLHRHRRQQRLLLAEGDDAGHGDRPQARRRAQRVVEPPGHAERQDKQDLGRLALPLRKVQDRAAVEQGRADTELAAIKTQLIKFEITVENGYCDYHPVTKMGYCHKVIVTVSVFYCINCDNYCVIMITVTHL